MSRSAPGPPLFLIPALNRVQRLLDEATEPLTAQQIRDQLVAEAFQWPTRDSASSYRQDSPKVTLPKVRAVLRRLYGYGAQQEGWGHWVSTRR